MPDGESADLPGECARLDAALASWGGVDVQLLGIGLNGHLCFIEPADALPAGFFVSPIAPENRARYAADFDGDAAAVPTHAVTYGLGTLLTARRLVLVAVGAAKAPLVRRAILDPVSTRFPASFLQVHSDVLVILDPAAAAELPVAELAARPNTSVVLPA